MRKLIIVEGLPCSGKSTTAKYIAEQLGMTFIDVGSCAHPADYEFDSFLTENDISLFSPDEQELIISHAEDKCGGYVIPLAGFNGELFDKLLSYKIYDFLPWETERPVMLDKWHRFAKKSRWEFRFQQHIFTESDVRNYDALRL